MTKFLGLFFGALCFASFFQIQSAIAQTPDETSAQEIFFEAEKALKNHDYDAALNLTVKAQDALGMNNGLLQSITVRAHYGAGRYQQTQSSLTEFYELSPSQAIHTNVSHIIANIDDKLAEEKNRDAQPLVRVPPIIPPLFLQGDHSGFCRMRFDISATGDTSNIVATLCTSSVLEASAITAVKGYKFSPRLSDFIPATTLGARSSLKFQLMDEAGNELPMPDGYTYE